MNNGQKIIELIANFYRVDSRQLKTEEHLKDFRKWTIYLIHEYAELNAKQIADLFGCTFWFAKNAIKSTRIRMQEDKFFKKYIYLFGELLSEQINFESEEIKTLESCEGVLEVMKYNRAESNI